ncbi:hypothetical protein N9R79_01460 [Vibrio sp.]|nr:hypothetical protein [Vibrio sp.]
MTKPITEHTILSELNDVEHELITHVKSKQFSHIGIYEQKLYSLLNIVLTWRAQGKDIAPEIVSQITRLKTIHMKIVTLVERELLRTQRKLEVATKQKNKIHAYDKKKHLHRRKELRA